MESFDLVVIGGGPAGYLAGERAGAAGLRTAVIEQRALGGVCLNEGCIPSKTLLHSAKILDYARHGEKYGVTISDAVLNHAAVVRRKNKVVKTLVSGVAAGLKRSGVTVFSGAGRIDGKTPEGFTVTAGTERLLAKRLLLASGSAPIVPDLPGMREGIERGFVLTSREIFDLTEPPRELAVIGGGVIGLELAGYFCAAGSKVTVIEAADKIAGPTDADISEILRKNYAAKGVVFELEAMAAVIGTDSITFEQKGERRTIPADKVLLSVGRRAVTDGLGLETLGVHIERGAVVTDENMRTSVSGIYAAGDINGRSMLAHTAYREAEAAVNHMLGIKDKMRYHAIPSVIYGSPEAAGVGETEQSARAKGLDVQIVKLPMQYSGRYLAETEGGDGIVKLIVDKRRGCLAGAHLVGGYAGEIIYGAALMIEREMRIDDIKRAVFPHPTVCEVIREALFAL